LYFYQAVEFSFTSNVDAPQAMSVHSDDETEPMTDDAPPADLALAQRNVIKRPMFAAAKATVPKPAALSADGADRPAARKRKAATVSSPATPADVASAMSATVSPASKRSKKTEAANSVTQPAAKKSSADAGSVAAAIKSILAESVLVFQQCYTECPNLDLLLSTMLSAK